jgi:hypothetical protein
VARQLPFDGLLFARFLFHAPAPWIEFWRSLPMSAEMLHGPASFARPGTACL